MVKKIIFHFTGDNMDNLVKIQKEGYFSMPMDCLTESMRILNGLQRQAKEGYCELIVRNPRTGEERAFMVPHLEKISDKHMPLPPEMNEDTTQGA